MSSVSTKSGWSRHPGAAPEMCIQCGERPPDKPRRLCKKCRADNERQARIARIEEQSKLPCAIEECLLPRAVTPTQVKTRCRKHQREYQAALRRAQGVPEMTPRLPGLPDNQWWCPRCKEVKPISDFNKAAGKERGLASRCKKCEREVYEERRAANPEHFRALACASGKRNRIRSLYGVTREEFDARVVEQDGRCAACGKQRKLVTDHDHAHTAPGTRDAVRGLICGKCNSALGFLDDDADLMLLLIKYVLNPPYPFR